MIHFYNTFLNMKISYVSMVHGCGLEAYVNPNEVSFGHLHDLHAACHDLHAFEAFIMCRKA